MNFNGRWVPPELMNLILVLWLIAAVMLGLLLYRMRAKAKQLPPERGHQKTAKRRSNKKKR
jgi:hypothetical protein